MNECEMLIAKVQQNNDFDDNFRVDISQQVLIRMKQLFVRRDHLRTLYKSCLFICKHVLVRKTRFSRELKNDEMVHFQPISSHLTAMQLGPQE